MKASIIIPVWNGAPVVLECLGALYAHGGDQIHEVVCVDNASPDDAGGRIAAAYPQARLLPQPVNRGFAGGVNAGLAAASGDVFILLNQDCLVQAGWLPALLGAIQAFPEFGLFGCTIEDAGGALDHTGAFIRRPDAAGVHRTDPLPGAAEAPPVGVEFVTGAALAMPRTTWERVGPFDEGYYPAYYEDADYCYRARRLGIETAWVPGARLRHLFSSTQWQTDPIGHAANGYRGRYRFVSKHFSSAEAGAFFSAEVQALAKAEYLNHLLGRTLAARHTLRQLPQITALRQAETGEPVEAAFYCQLEAGFGQVASQALQAADDLARRYQSAQPPASLTPPLPEINLAADLDEQGRLAAQWGESYQNVEALRQRQQALLAEMQAACSTPHGRKHLPAAEWSGERQLELAVVQQARLDALESRLELAAHRTEHYRRQNEALLTEIRRLAAWCRAFGARADESQQALNLLEERLQILLQLNEHDSF